MNVRNNNPVRVGEFHLLLGDDLWTQNLETERPIFQLSSTSRIVRSVKMFTPAWSVALHSTRPLIIGPTKSGLNDTLAVVQEVGHCTKARMFHRRWDWWCYKTGF